MKPVNIMFPEYFDKINIENDNIDVFVELEDGMIYTLVVTTPNNYYWYMDKEDLDYIPATPPDIIVRRLTKDIISKAIENYLENDAYWLKQYFLAGEFDINLMNKMIKVIKKDNDEIFKK